MSDYGITVRLSGPLFHANARDAVIAGADEGLTLVAQHGQGLVQGQLYPGHGVVTGHLRRSIHGGLATHLHAQIDAGLILQGANVEYAEWIEGTGRRNRLSAFKGYGMFAFAYRALQNLDVSKFIVDHIVKRLS